MGRLKWSAGSASVAWTERSDPGGSWYGD